MKVITQNNPYSKTPNDMLLGISNLVNAKKFGETSDMTIDRNGQISVSVSLEGNKSICFRLVPTNDNYNMWSMECIKDGADRKNFNMKSSTFVMDYIKKELDEVEYVPSFVGKSLAKGKEPISRQKADEAAPTEDQLNKAIEQLTSELEKSRKDDLGDEEDEMEEWNAEAEYKNIVKTFPKDTPKIEGEKTPKKTNVDQHNPKEQKVVLKESLKQNWDDELGFVVTPTSVPDNRPRRNTIVPTDPRKDDMMTLFSRRAGLKGQV